MKLCTIEIRGMPYDVDVDPDSGAFTTKVGDEGKPVVAPSLQDLRNIVFKATRPKTLKTRVPFLMYCPRLARKENGETKDGPLFIASYGTGIHAGNDNVMFTHTQNFLRSEEADQAGQKRGFKPDMPADQQKLYIEWKRKHSEAETSIRVMERDWMFDVREAIMDGIKKQDAP